MEKHFIFNVSTNKIQQISDRPLTDENVVDILSEETDGLNQTNAFLMLALRKKRDTLIKNTIWIHERHLSQNPKTLTDPQYAEWMAYWQSLRDLPATVNLTGITLSNLNTVFPAQPLIQ